MSALLSVIVTWLSIAFGLPASYDHPRIEFARPDQMFQLRYGNTSMEARPEVLSVYDDVNRVIYLNDSCTHQSIADLSILVHEMVHHLQNASSIRHACPAAREELAYLAQDRWLNLFGRNLVEEFQLDRMFLKLSTLCMWT